MLDVIQMDNVDLKVELLCRGALVAEEGWDYYKRSAGFQIKIDGTLVSVPSIGKYDRYSFVKGTPYEIVRTDSTWGLKKDGELLREVTVADVPEFYEEVTSDGVKMKKVFQVCGWTCLLTGVVQSCSLQRTGTECRFCGTIYNPEYEGRLDTKTPRQLAEAAVAGYKEGMEHIVITSGIMPSPDRGARLLEDAAKAIRDLSDIPIQAELAPPKDMKYLESLCEHVDSVSINVETIDQDIRAAACPDKSQISYDDYFRAWEISRDILGDNQVNSWLIAGLGETDEVIIDGATRLADAGVFPFLVPLRSTKGTGFEKMPTPTAERIGTLGRKVAGIAKDAGLEPEKCKAGCLKCSACSPVRDFMLKL